MSYKFSKGWFVAELKKQNVRYINGRKLELYKKHVLANQYRIVHEKSEEKN